jgi:hypothetical protein
LGFGVRGGARLLHPWQSRLTCNQAEQQQCFSSRATEAFSFFVPFFSHRDSNIDTMRTKTLLFGGFAVLVIAMEPDMPKPTDNLAFEMALGMSPRPTDAPLVNGEFLRRQATSKSVIGFLGPDSTCGYENGLSGLCLTSCYSFGQTELISCDQLQAKPAMDLLQSVRVWFTVVSLQWVVAAVWARLLAVTSLGNVSTQRKSLLHHYVVRAAYLIPTL